MSTELSPDQVRQTIVARPNDARACFAWATQRVAEKPVDAVTWSKRAVLIEPLAAPPRSRLSHALWRLGRSREALESAKRGLVLVPPDWSTIVNAGVIQKRLGLVDDSLRACLRATAAGAPDRMAVMNAAVLRLRAGDFARGWPLYRARYHALGADPRKIWPGLKEWRGEQVHGHMYVVTEQGIGDSIMFMTLIPALAERATSLSLMVNTRMLTLIRRSFPDLHVLAPGADGALEPLPPAECWVCIGDAPAALGLFCGGAVTPKPYLVPDPDRVRRLRDLLRRRHPGKRLVGITWTSKADDGWRRSIAPPLWQPLAALDHIALISLQYGADTGDLALFGQHIDCDHGIEPLSDLDGLAALVATMDEVVSPPNNTVHFAGALGVPTRVMLPVDPEWRWGEDGSDCRWYDATRVYRQTRDGDWLPVIQAVARDLAHRD